MLNSIHRDDIRRSIRQPASLEPKRAALSPLWVGRENVVLRRHESCGANPHLTSFACGGVSGLKRGFAVAGNALKPCGFRHHRTTWFKTLNRAIRKADRSCSGGPASPEPSPDSSARKLPVARVVEQGFRYCHVEVRHRNGSRLQALYVNARYTAGPTRDPVSGSEIAVVAGPTAAKKETNQSGSQRDPHGCASPSCIAHSGAHAFPQVGPTSHWPG